MSFSQVRTYINSRIATLYPDLIEWQDAFNVENIPTVLLNTRYHIQYGSSTSSSQIDKHIEDLFGITITIFKQGYNSENTAIDELMDIAHCIRMDLIDHRNLETFGGDLEDFISTSITPTPIAASNDNIIQVQLEFNVRLTFGFN